MRTDAGGRMLGASQMRPPTQPGSVSPFRQGQQGPAAADREGRTGESPGAGAAKAREAKRNRRGRRPAGRSARKARSGTRHGRADPERAAGAHRATAMRTGDARTNCGGSRREIPKASAARGSGPCAACRHKRRSGKAKAADDLGGIATGSTCGASGAGGAVANMAGLRRTGADGARPVPGRPLGLKAPAEWPGVGRGGASCVGPVCRLFCRLLVQDEPQPLKIRDAENLTK